MVPLPGKRDQPDIQERSGSVYRTAMGNIHIEINKKYVEKEMEVSLPLFMIGFKDNIKDKYNEVVKRHIAIEIILNMLIGKSSNLYNELYKEGYLLSQPDLEYEFGNEYSHVLIGGQSKNPQKVYEKIAEKIQEMKNNDIIVREFERIKKKLSYYNEDFKINIIILVQMLD